MKALILTLALTGTALAQSSVTVPALPPGASGTAQTGTSTTATPSISTGGTASSAASATGSAYTLRFSPKPGTALEYAVTSAQRFEVASLRLEPLPNVRLTAQKEQERQALEAKLQRDFPKQIPQTPPQASKQFLRVLPPLADGSQVLLSTLVLPLNGKPASLRFQQTVSPAGQPKTQLLEASDPALRQVFTGLTTQFSKSFGGTDISLLGRSFTPGQAVNQTVSFDMGAFLGSLLGSLGGSNAQGRFDADTTTTFAGQDPSGNARFEVSSRFKDTQISVKLRDLSMTIGVQGLGSTGQSLVRPDGLSAGGNTHTEGGMTLSLNLPGEPFVMVIELQLTQDVSTVLR